ncbi:MULTISPECIES: DUF4097 family beta strand repeat-containing protein [unclassified Kitasatospora]|uniref:DUF4097 family beta strand repeat-containing protein n=1 Tax=unclassified Kitasatospora TaxID=2633591 RepID=UPI00070D35DC|nr:MULTISPECIES: DUF4097 family beta strand repeat-containing protein [unclassified Kitasatospora]KQV23772.1 hypothetical protein ASC99_00610 [Kitasatospora sp. Root107]KRB67515.1 hypothetical protein ASE03_04125 [Kitasatospora sp. Root187]
MGKWTVSEPDSITFDEPVGTLNVRVIAGAVNVVTAEGPARLEISELKGDPLQVTLENGVLTVTYPDLAWSELTDSIKSLETVKSFFSGLRRKREAVAEVSLTVPAGSEVKIGSASADTTVSGVTGQVTVYGASGETTLVGLTGRTEVKTVSGDVNAQSVAGELRVNTVSGHLTVVAGTGDKLVAKSVSGSVTLDVDTATPTDLHVNTVSGPVAVRLPSQADAKVELGSTGGELSSTFEELTVSGGWGTRKLSGQLGSGTGRLQVSTVSGAVTVQRRPEAEAERIDLVKELPAAPTDTTTQES